MAQHVTDHTNDKQEIGPALARLDALPEVLGAVDALLADTGYHSQENLERCAAAGIDPAIPEARQRHNPPLAERLADDPPPLQGQPTPAEANAHRLRTRDGKARDAKRKATVETVFGIIKHVQGTASPYLILATLFLMTLILGLFVVPAATAVLMAPLAMALAAELGTSPYPFAIIVALAASSAFMTPVVPANAMVGTLGGYRFGDYARIGLPLVVLVMTLALTLVPWLYPF